jgi:hypothetical protein
MAVQQMRFVLVNNRAPLRGVCTTAGTELPSRSFHVKTLLRGRVLRSIDSDE